MQKLHKAAAYSRCGGFNQTGFDGRIIQNETEHEAAASRQACRVGGGYFVKHLLCGETAIQTANFTYFILHDLYAV
ncbi:hypothetical protein [Neisseria animalis]|uniref:hypothetical protein n=1 Tax=Neisseria animalis TaxID=492 RepID=UPI001B876658|nr:hypothetical protein [Neisseria animalis]